MEIIWGGIIRATMQKSIDYLAFQYPYEKRVQKREIKNTTASSEA